MTDNIGPMVSRSLRLRKDTLEVLHELAQEQQMGITVFIRTVLESLVAERQKLSQGYEELTHGQN